MKILFMADVPPDPSSGASGTEIRTIEALRRLGHEVDEIWAPQLGRRIKHGNLHYLLELPRAYRREVRRAVARSSYDVIHVNQPHGFLAARAIHQLSPRTVFIHRSHGFELNVEQALQPWRERFGSDERNAVLRFASRALTPLLARHARAIARDADGHIVSSSLDAAFLRERLGVPRDRIAVIPQAAPDSYLRDDAPPMNEQRLRRVLHVGQFAFVKAPMITAEAINQLAALEPELQFTWVCDRSNEGDVRAMLTPEANQRTAVRHWTAQDALRDVYDEHGIFLFPSFFEGFGKAFLEAMSRGLCVIASDVGGMHDLIDGENGSVVPPGDAVALADAALRIIRDPESAIAMSAAAARKAREYTWERVGLETAAFYQSRLAARGAV
jgi:glycosyltransferase involved in cell wall biosynthesis